ncbi:MAG: ABC transporter ATP-binding protein [Candidatus Sericytochromatia bacterium]|nr:MAG: ABC transporter ATP-binding protein [Candidatus Sericytochromatia bacterium]
MNYLKYFKDYKIKLAQIITLTILSILVSIGLIPLSRNIVYVFSSNSLQPLINLGLYVIFIYFLRGLFFFLQNFITSNLAIEITTDIKLDLYKSIIFDNYENVRDKNIGDIINTLTDDITKVRELIISFFIELIPSLIMISFTLTYIFYLNWKLSLLIFLLILLISLNINYFLNKVRNYSRKTQEINSNIINSINEDLNNFYIIKNLRLEEIRYKNIEKNQKIYNNNLLKTFKYIYLQPSIIGLLQVIGIVIIAIFATYQMLLGNINLKDLISFGTAISLTIEPAIFITSSIGKISKNIISFERITNFISKNIYKINNEFKVNNYDIYINNLSYSINGKNILENINLEIKQGDCIVIKGNNGAGKSTLVSIISGIIKNYKGSVKIGGIELIEIDKEFLKKNIRISCHEAFIFHGTIKDNILLGNQNLKENELIEICNILEINNYNKEVGNFGNNLSSGQKQKVSIARAIASKPLILILDEALSAIDKETEIKIYNNLRNYLKNTTFIIISHRKVNLDFVDFEFEL